MQDWIGTILVATIVSKVRAKTAGTEAIVIATVAAVTTEAVQKAAVTVTSAKAAVARTTAVKSASSIVAAPSSVTEWDRECSDDGLTIKIGGCTSWAA